MPTIEEILRAAKEAGASDVHLTVGIPPKMRVNGNLITMDYPRMLPADTLEVLVNIMTEVQRERFEERGEYDMSFSIPNCGRYRVNAYKQRGSRGSGVPTGRNRGAFSGRAGCTGIRGGTISAQTWSGTGHRTYRKR